MFKKPAKRSEASRREFLMTGAAAVAAAAVAAAAVPEGALASRAGPAASSPAHSAERRGGFVTTKDGTHIYFKDASRMIAGATAGR